LTSQEYWHRRDILNSRNTTAKMEELKEARINKVQDNMPGEGTVHETREEGDLYPTCNRTVEENEIAVACGGTCQR
jgi:hypothetical protein